jgi:hypothetical protein
LKTFPFNVLGKRGIIFMHSSVELTVFAHRAILSHLVDIEERKNEIVDSFYPEPSPSFN